MVQVIESPFESIENAHDFLHLLGETIFETKWTSKGTSSGNRTEFSRRAEALKLTSYTLNKTNFTCGEWSGAE